MQRLTTLSKFLIVLVVVAIAAGGIWYLKGNKNLLESIAPDGKGGVKNEELSKKAIKVGVMTWGGHVGGEYFNEGFHASEQSRYFKELGILVEFVLNDDFNASREAWKAGEVDVLCGTIDAMPTEIEGFKGQNPQVIFQSDWSRGGDAVVVRRGINTVADLKGKSIAVTPMTPSQTFLLWLLEAGGLKYSDVNIKESPSAIDAAAYFKAGQVDAAVVWSPDDEDCVANVKGSKILKNTKGASHIIADVFFVKKSFLDENRETLEKLVQGWMIGNAEINTSDASKKKAAKIFADGSNMPEDFCYNAINNARLCTLGDNINFFQLNKDYNGVTGEELYNKMGTKYAELKYAPAKLPAWRIISSPSIVKNIQLTGDMHEAETDATFSPVTKEIAESEAFSTKAVRITFASGSFVLDENAKYIIDREFTDIAKGFKNSRIRIEGNTDNVGDAAMNKKLSLKRAQAVADYLMKEHGFPANRFVIVGNGADKPVADNGTEKGKAQNRRTDFELLGE